MKEKINKLKNQLFTWLKSDSFIISLMICILIGIFKYPEGSFYEWLLIWALLWMILGWIELLEKYILKHITTIIFFLIFFLLTEKENFIEYKDLYLVIWWIFAFWYWYKKYERDKELDFLEKINLNINNFNNQELIIDWHIKYILYKKWYLKKYVWEILEDKYVLSLYERLMLLWFYKEWNDNILVENIYFIKNLDKYEESKEYFMIVTQWIIQILNSEINLLERDIKEKRYIDTNNIYEYLSELKTGIIKDKVIS